MGSTNVFAIKRAVYALLAESDSLSDVQVSYSLPNNVERRSIYVGKCEWDSTEWATLRAREEKFFVSVRLMVYIKGGTAEECDEEMERMTQEFEAVMKENPGMGNPAIVTSSVEPVEFDTFPSDDGYLAGIDYEVRFTARY